MKKHYSGTALLLTNPYFEKKNTQFVIFFGELNVE
jgi:hypothetical protein